MSGLARHPHHYQGEDYKDPYQERHTFPSDELVRREERIKAHIEKQAEFVRTHHGENRVGGYGV